MHDLSRLLVYASAYALARRLWNVFYKIDSENGRLIDRFIDNVRIMPSRDTNSSSLKRIKEYDRLCNAQPTELYVMAVRICKILAKIDRFRDKM